MAYRSSSLLAGASASSAAVPVPAGAAIGDIAVVGIYLELAGIITPPAGFTSKADLATNPTTQGRLAVFWKRLTAADSGTYTFSWTGTAFTAGSCGLFSGRATSGDPFDGTVGSAESVASVTTLGVSTSPTFGGGDAVGFWTDFTGGNAWTPPGTYSERQDGDVITLDTSDAVAAGTTGTITPTANISGFLKGFIGVLQPAVVRVNSASVSASGTTAIPYGTAIGVACNVGDLLILTADCNGTHATNGMSCQETTSFQTFTTISETQQGGASSRWQQTFYLVLANPLTATDSIELTPYGGNTSSTFTVDVFRGTTGVISRAVQIVSGASGTTAAAPALASAPPAGDLVLSLTAVSSGTATQPSPFALGSQRTTGPTTSCAYVLAADGVSTYGGTWTWGTANTSALQTVAFGAAAVATVAVGSPAVPRLGRRFPTPMTLARNVTQNYTATGTTPAGPYYQTSQYGGFF